MEGTPPWVDATEMLSRGRSAEELGTLGDVESSATVVRAGRSAVDPELNVGCFGAGAERESNSE
jgi:hypothetical protein